MCDIIALLSPKKSSVITFSLIYAIGTSIFEHVLRCACCRVPQISGVICRSWGAVWVVWWEMNSCVSGEFGMVVYGGSVVRRGDGSCAGENECVD